MGEPMYMSDMDVWLAAVRLEIENRDPELIDLFDTYAQEARFGRKYIANDLLPLRAGAEILEIGAGSMLLSCQLVREGFRVSALEPIGSGFSHFDRICGLVVEVAADMCCLPQRMDVPAEFLHEYGRYDYAFSVNVMEHVADVGRVLINVCESLVRGGHFRFICPNYLFPYEPHFNMPIFFTKKISEIFVRRRVLKYDKVPDAIGVWDSLNWINVLKVSRLVRNMKNGEAVFMRDTLGVMFERMATDPQFASRRSRGMRQLISMLMSIRMHRMLKFVPASMQPIMDCRIEKTR